MLELQRKRKAVKEKLEPVKHGLYRKPKPITSLDGRRREVKAWNIFVSGIEGDLGGELSFAQRALAEICFWKYYALSEFMRTLLLSGKEHAALALMSERNSRQFNVTSNSFRLDLAQIYGGDLKKVERRVESLQEYLRKLPSKTEPNGEPND